LAETLPRAEELDEDFLALTMRGTLAEARWGVNAGKAGHAV